MSFFTYPDMAFSLHSERSINLQSSRYLRCVWILIAISQWLFIASITAAEEQASKSDATFIRGLNLNGPSIEIDGNRWLGNESSTFECNGNAFENNTVVLKPKTDSRREQMIRSSRWGTSLDIVLKELQETEYRVFAYVWEDNASETYQIKVNDKVVVPSHTSGNAGTWKRLGPWPAKTINGTITISARGGAANFSGIEVWSHTGELPVPPPPEFNRSPTEDQIAFFEAKVRPVLIEHCYSCHSAEAKDLGGSLLLDSFSGIAKGGDSGAVVIPHDADSSLLITAIRYKKPELQMPPTRKLDDHQIRAIEEWVEMGAPDPREDDTVSKAITRQSIDWEKATDFWSLRPIPQSPPIPSVANSSWALNSIDYFILDSMHQHQLEPSHDSDRTAWLRRATYDLTGMPPTPEQVDAFCSDNSSLAYDHVVDRLLASKAYAERWGRHWLDVVRYADTAGDNSDFPIPQMIKYRDWVTDAFHRDMPYDQFITHQLAGDLLPSDSESQRRAQIIATGYIANSRRFGSRVDDYPHHLTIEDTLDNFGRAFLATTLNCARCHDHKFDPITTDDYYGLYGIFRSTRYPWPGIELDQRQRDLIPLTSQDIVAQETKERNQAGKALETEIKKLEKSRDQADQAEKKKWDDEIKKAKDSLDTLRKRELPYEVAYAVTESETIEDAAIQIKGDPNKVGATVPRHFPTMLGGQRLPPGDSSSGRKQLAQWLVSTENPLTARVMVNRIWSYHFGKGIVPTPNDFGRQGKPPTHPELLDWLARDFIQSGWSIKSLHRCIMLSHTYRLSSLSSEATREIDPTNQWLSHFPRKRLDAESIRDTLLVLGGNLNSETGAPHPFPPSTEWKFTQHNPFKAIYDTNHRSVYLMTQRIQRHPFLAIFDGADPSVSTAFRNVSTSPLQALYFLNDPFVHAQSTAFAMRVMQSSTADDERIRFAFRNLFSRPPSDEDLATSIAFLHQVRTSLDTSSNISSAETEAWNAFVRALMRTNEFVYID